jgi:hypothetical protein
MRKGKDTDPDPYLCLMDPDPGGQIRIPNTAFLLFSSLLPPFPFSCTHPVKINQLNVTDLVNI